MPTKQNLPAYSAINPAIDERAVRFFETAWNSQRLHIGGVICFESKVSNGIKFFTQSLFSHTNFFVNDGEATRLTVGAEDLKSVVCLDYGKKRDENFYYVAKKIDFERIARMFSFDYADDVFGKIGKTKESEKETRKSIRRFVEYAAFRDDGDSENLPGFREALSGPVELRKTLSEERRGQLMGDVEAFVAFRKAVKSMEDRGFEERRVRFATLKRYLQEFLLLGILRKCVAEYGKRYDLEGTLSISVTPWDAPKHPENGYFCSQFVADALVYAGIYPFDVETKSPEAVSPGDIMDMSGIYSGKTSLWKLSKTDGFQEISDLKRKTIKAYVIAEEEGRPYFQRQRLLTGAFRWALGYLVPGMTEREPEGVHGRAAWKTAPMVAFAFMVWMLAPLVSAGTLKMSGVEWAVESPEKKWPALTEWTTVSVSFLGELGTFCLKVVIWTIIAWFVIWKLIPWISATLHTGRNAWFAIRNR